MLSCTVVVVVAVCVVMEICIVVSVCVPGVVKLIRLGLFSCSTTGVQSAVYREMVWAPAAERFPGNTGGALGSKEGRPEIDGVVSVVAVD